MCLRKAWFFGAGLVFFFAGVADTVAESPSKVCPLKVEPLFGNYSKPLEMYDKARVASGKMEPSILHFWGTWCGPCRDEITPLLEFSRKDSGVTIRAVAVGDSPGSIARFLSLLPEKLRREVFRDNPRVIFAAFVGDLESPESVYYDLGTFPTTLFVDSNGNIVLRVEGTIDWLSKKTKRAVQLFLRNEPFSIEPEK